MEPELRPPIPELPPTRLGKAEVDDEVGIAATVSLGPLKYFVVNCRGEEGGGWVFRCKRTSWRNRWRKAGDCALEVASEVRDATDEANVAGNKTLKRRA
jgi:hypothetical protein